MLLAYDSRALKEEILRGKTRAELCLENDWTETQFEEALNALFTTGRDRNEIKKALGKNEEKVPKADSAPRVYRQENAEDVLEIISMQKSHFEEKISQMEQELDALEQEHRSFVLQRAEINATLQSDWQVLKKLQEQVEAIQAGFLKKKEKLEALGKQMQSLNEPISQKRAQLSNLHEEVVSKKVAVYVYENGGISLNDTPVKVFPEYRGIFAELSERDDLQFYQLAQVVQLAKLMGIVRLLNAKEIEYEILFENNVLEASYNNL